MLKTNKSSQSSRIPEKVLKLFKISLSESILLTANLSFEINTQNSKALNQPNVTPIFKIDDHTLCNNYCEPFHSTQT